MNRRTLIALAAAVGLTTPLPASAKVLTWVCKFEQPNNAAPLSFVFNLDDVTGEAYLQVNQGLSKVSFHVGDNGMSF